MSFRPRVAVVFGNAPESLSSLCGISLAERLLRVLQRLGFTRAIIIAITSELRTELSRSSWARAGVTLAFAESGDAVADVLQVLTKEDSPAAIVRADYYYDPRLLGALMGAAVPSFLVESDARRNGSGSALITRDWLSARDQRAHFWSDLEAAAAADEIALIGVSEQPAYLASMRREITPEAFRVATAADRRAAQKVILDGAQNGTLDIPAIVHAPLETAIVSRLCRTSVTPNQVTFATFVIGVVTAGLFACGHLWSGLILALAIGVLDGVDGKLARVKVETTELGSWEHSLDYVVEFAWWTALAFHFERAGELPHVFGLLLLFFVSDAVGRLAKRAVKQRLGRNLDDVSTFDRWVRYVAGRRNIYVWIFATGLLLHQAATAFAWICWWSVASSAIYAIRAVQIAIAARPRQPAPPRQAAL